METVASSVCAQAVLLVGFAQQEVDAFRALMIDMDADMVKVTGGHAQGPACVSVGTSMAAGLTMHAWPADHHMHTAAAGRKLGGSACGAGAAV